jgi:hypothetical protein
MHSLNTSIINTTLGELLFQDINFIKQDQILYFTQILKAKSKKTISIHAVAFEG